MKKNASIILLLMIFFSCEKNKESPNPFNDPWQKLSTPYYGEPQDVKFSSADTGYILGSNYRNDSIYNILIKTDDGGQTWQSISYTDHKFLTDTSGGVLGSIYVLPFNSNVLFTGGGGHLLRSVDGGYHWQRMDTVNKIGSSIMQFFDPSNGICVGGEIAAKTTDSGINWSQTFSQSSLAFLQLLQFTSGQIGYIAGGIAFDGSAVGVLAKSLDGGNSWQVINFPFADIISMSFINDNIGFISVITDSGNVANDFRGYQLIKTIDGGQTWQVLQQTPDDNKDNGYNKIYFKTELEGFGINSHGIFHTVDGSATWQKEHDGFMYLMCFPDAHTGYAIDTSGTVFKRFF
jgi:photosystem II stability/assembly factor-like uncharacterized protein